MKCKICSETSGAYHILREMLFGTNDEFTYWECSACGCLQIAEIPKNLADYYPTDYYSFSAQATPLQLWMYRAYFKAPRLVGLVRRPGVTFQAVLDVKPKVASRVLDVGCGRGKMVAILRSLGVDAHGIDPFTKDETTYVRRARLEDTNAKDWDLIMFHHSLEHMVDHIDVLRAARERLAPLGTCLVRIPVANWAWQHYKENWVQLDPPRHLIIHTPLSFRAAAGAAGFRISRTIYDSGAYQFYGSEMYQRSIPMTQEAAEIVRLGKSGMRSLTAQAAELNRQQLGDQASFHLEKLDP
jgi:SAM-dependent methyltransferase